MLSVRSRDPLNGSKEAKYTRDTETMPTVASNSCSTLTTEDKVRDGAEESVSNFKAVHHNNSDDASPSQVQVTEGTRCSNNENGLEEQCFITSESERRSCSTEPDQGGEWQQEQNSDVIIGPLLTDINSESVVDSAEPNQGDREDSSDEDLEYKQALATRKQLLSDEANRQRIREELERTYAH